MEQISDGRMTVGGKGTRDHNQVSAAWTTVMGALGFGVVNALYPAPILSLYAYGILTSPIEAAANNVRQLVITAPAGLIISTKKGISPVTRERCSKCAVGV